MKCDIAVLADAANVSREGKLNICGIFKNIYSAQLPLQWPIMVMALQLGFDKSEKGKQHTLGVKLVGPDGKAIQQLPDLNIDIAADTPGEMPGLPITLNLINVGLATYGVYRFELTANGDALGEVVFEVGPPPAQN
ncbi:MAG: hypothetical protein M3Y28_11260 [Armatimonadota bacterium]|nr:hypothetical protein [Armatimonadota bacterium]